MCVRGPMRMLGYHDPEQTAQAIDGDGFLHTGDLGHVDGRGILHLTGRKKDIIIRNGVNLSPRRIEEALLSLPGVRRWWACPTANAGSAPGPLWYTRAAPCPG